MMEQNEKELFLTPTHFGEENETGEKLSGDADRISEDAVEYSDDAEQSGREFEELIKGRFADAFAARVQKIIDKRFKHTKLLEQRVAQEESFRERLSSLCGGDSPEAEVILKRVGELVSSNEGKELSPEEAISMEARTRALYPDFSAEREMKSETFRAYVERGLDFSEAYALSHLDKIKEEARREGVREAVLSIGSMGRRPAEGSRSSARPPAPRRVADLDSSEIKTLIERASKGERIKFKDI